MTVKQRMLMISLTEKIERNKDYAKKLGIEVVENRNTVKIENKEGE